MLDVGDLYDENTCKTHRERFGGAAGWTTTTSSTPWRPVMYCCSNGSYSNWSSIVNDDGYPYFNAEMGGQWDRIDEIGALQPVTCYIKTSEFTCDSTEETIFGTGQEDVPTTDVFTETLKNGYEVTLTGFTHKRPYAREYIRTTAGNASATITGLIPKEKYYYDVYQYSSSVSYLGQDSVERFTVDDGWQLTNGWDQAEAFCTDKKMELCDIRKLSENLLFFININRLYLTNK